MTLKSVSMLSEDFVDSDNFSTNQLVLRKRNCKMSSKLMLRHCENMKRTKKLRQPPTLTACQNSTKTTLIFSIILIIFAVSGKQTFLNQALYSKYHYGYSRYVQFQKNNISLLLFII